MKHHLAPINKQQINTKAVKGVLNKQTNKKSEPKVKTQSTVIKRTAIPASFGYSERGAPANITTAGKDVRVRHSEYIGEVFGSVNFGVTTYTIQPGNSTSFPWLSSMSYLYESYTIHKLHYRFESSKSTASNGAVMMAIDFDVADAAPPSKTQLLAYNRYVRSPVWEECVYMSDPRDLKLIEKRYIRSATVANTDNRLYDTGAFFIATQGCADTSVIGELHVDYEITLHTPQYDLGAFASAGSNRSSATSGVTNTLILGTTPTLNATGSGITIGYNTTTGAVTLGSVGQFLITYAVQSSTAYSGTPTVTMTGGSTVSTINFAASTGLAQLQFTVNMLNSTDTFTVGGWVAGTTPTNATLRIASYPFNL